MRKLFVIATLALAAPALAGDPAAAGDSQPVHGEAKAAAGISADSNRARRCVFSGERCRVDRAILSKCE